MSVANVLEFRFKLPFMRSLMHGKTCSSHEFFTPKKDICRNPMLFFYDPCVRIISNHCHSI